VNGHLLGHNQGSKTPAEWDITDKFKQGENHGGIGGLPLERRIILGVPGYVALEWY
jgi:Glycosyl hydrolases family 2, sugar binding domain.